MLWDLIVSVWGLLVFGFWTIGYSFIAWFFFTLVVYIPYQEFKAGIIKRNDQ